MVHLNVTLPDSLVKEVRESDYAGWFTPFEFNNARSPDHSKRFYYQKRYEWKSQLLNEWIDRFAPDRRVLDLFCANGAFSVRAALAGAKEVTGVDAEESRISVADLLARSLEGHVDTKLGFHVRDVHEVLAEDEVYDLVMCFGGLYHVSDPAAMLEKLYHKTSKYAIIQTSHVVQAPGSWGWFRLPRGQDTYVPQWPSETGGWSLTAGCYRRLLRNAGFRILEEQRPPYALRPRFRWYAAMVEKVV
ncbi:class I SAM-dependent methyltransferase [Streptomyces cyaneofuscatus]|uniref:class I SAM-dependent methyltransferase n=1 Tax=Streptomyces cyaneofuscatus TaxID=66883 RepID=UPI0033BB14A4